MRESRGEEEPVTGGFRGPWVEPGTLGKEQRGEIPVRGVLPGGSDFLGRQPPGPRFPIPSFWTATVSTKSTSSISYLR